MAGRDQSVEGDISTSHEGLAQIRDRGGQRDAELRERIMGAMLEVCGELGYRGVSVQNVLDRYGGYRVQFYRQFAGKAECYAAAYEVEAERLCAALAGAGAAEPSWRGGLRAALRSLGRFVRERPALARGLLIEVHVAGGRALEKREEMFERLTRAIDSARREIGSRHSPPPMAALFMVGAIEEAVATALLRGEPEAFELAIPELTYMVVAAYFGEEAAEEELAGAQVG